MVLLLISPMILRLPYVFEWSKFLLRAVNLALTKIPKIHRNPQKITARLYSIKWKEFGNSEIVKIMKNRGSVSSQNLSRFPSPPGLPSHWENNVMNQKGWCSERVPQPSGRSKRNINVAGLTPFYSGRTLPSKWEDAERWIGSPLIGNGAVKSLQSLPRRRVKSKSGPIVAPPTVVSYNPSYSPEVAGNVTVSSALPTGVLAADCVSLCYGGEDDDYGGQSYYILSNPESLTEQLSCQPRWSDILSESSLPSSRDEKHDDRNEVMDSYTVSQRDMATQMSPEEGTESSLKGKSSFSSSSSPNFLSMVEMQSDHVSKLEVRDVQVDKGTTVVWWSKGHKMVKSGKKSPPSMDVGASSLDIAEAAINASKLKREEARIMAWENLQKSKAEAAIHKLEVKLERKRSSSIDNILNKLRKAQMKAHKMRSSLSVNQTNQVPQTYFRFRCLRKQVRVGSLRRYFTCYGS